jgi:GT2 family glycosyltransferase
VRNVGSDVPYEVVIVLNGSPDDVARFVREQVSGANVVESRVNRGVAGGYNLGRAAARGEYIVLLHEDTEVRPGWLEALVRAADETPTAGAVGGRALNSDGSLQSAGAIIHADGTSEERQDDVPSRRQVDYSSSNSLLVRASTWDAVGGLDERFFPAYHIDVDLGMKIRAHGQHVLYEPAAVVVHHRSGIARQGGFRAFAGRRNLARFVAKWHEGTLGEPTPSSDEDYLRLDLDVKNAYIDELESQLQDARRQLAEIAASRTWRLKRFLSRLAAPSRRE